MKIIGLTGGIGSGKSTVAGFLEEMGATVLDVDRVGHEALEPGSEGWQRAIEAFGRDILTTGDVIDRARLGRVVFNDPEARRRLNDILHPIIQGMADARLEEYRRRGVATVVLEAPLMLETGRQWQADEVWVTVAPEARVIERLRNKAGLTEAEARGRMQAQLSNEERIRHADVVIDTDCSLEELREKVATLWRGFRDRHDAESVDT
jgi:dephospho-CoA kinase